MWNLQIRNSFISTLFFSDDQEKEIYVLVTPLKLSDTGEFSWKSIQFIPKQYYLNMEYIEKKRRDLAERRHLFLDPPITIFWSLEDCFSFLFFWSGFRFWEKFFF